MYILNQNGKQISKFCTILWEEKIFFQINAPLQAKTDISFISGVGVSNVIFDNWKQDQTSA